MDYKPISGRQLPRFAGVKTFFRLPHVAVDADYEVGIAGVPFDGGVSYRPGARFAPTKVRELSSLGRAFHMGRLQSFVEKIKVADVGDCPTVPVSLEDSHKNIENYFANLMALKKRFIAVGGDHSTTLPVLRAVSKALKQPLALIHFDAHLDTYPAAWGHEYHHGAFFRHAVEEGLIDPKASHQIGIRGPLAGADDLDFVKKYGVHVHTVDEVRRGSMDQFVASLPRFDDQPVYISFDVDCLDPVYAPGTGTPVVGGLTTYETQKILRGLQIKNLVAADVVEISPPYDLSDLTSLVGVDVIFEYLSLFAAQS